MNHEALHQKMFAAKLSALLPPSAVADMTSTQKAARLCTELASTLHTAADHFKQSETRIVMSAVDEVLQNEATVGGVALALTRQADAEYAATKRKAHEALANSLVNAVFKQLYSHAAAAQGAQMMAAKEQVTGTATPASDDYEACDCPSCVPEGVSEVVMAS